MLCYVMSIYKGFEYVIYSSSSSSCYFQTDTGTLFSLSLSINYYYSYYVHSWVSRSLVLCFIIFGGALSRRSYKNLEIGNCIFKIIVPTMYCIIMLSVLITFFSYKKMTSIYIIITKPSQNFAILSYFLLLINLTLTYHWLIDASFFKGVTQIP